MMKSTTESGDKRTNAAKVLAINSVIFILALLMVSPAFATHTSSAELSPEWSAAGQTMEYTVAISNTADSAPIDEVRIFRALAYTDFDCKPKEGWELIPNITWYDSDVGGLTKMCWYYTLDPENNIQPDTTTSFEFSAKVPEQGCDHKWKFETRDEQSESEGAWRSIFDSTSVDDLEPVIHKDVIGTQLGTCPPEQGENCWVMQDTGIDITVTDQGDCGISGLESCRVTYTIDGGAPIEKIYADLDGARSWNYLMTFGENSVHALNVTCYDIAGNKLEDVETFKVDSEAPTTTKDFIGTQYPNNAEQAPYPHWINSSTLVTLSPIDGDPAHASGINKTYWRNTLIQRDGIPYNEPCESDYVCQDMQGYGNWSIYQETGAFHKNEDSCHLIEYYSTDMIGNEETIKKQCVYVDNQAPVVAKEVGTPQHLSSEQLLESVGNGVATWDNTERSLNAHSAKLVLPNNPTGADFAGVDSFFDVFVELDDINKITYDRKVTQLDEAWTPIIIIGIDADGDGVFEAKPLEWESTFNPALLGDDTFIQCEAQSNITGVDANFVTVDAYNTFKCYTPKTDGSAPYWDVYENLSYFQANSVGRVEPTDKVAMIKVEIGGNAATQNNEVAYVDNVQVNDRVVIDEPVLDINGDTEIVFSCEDQLPHPVGDVSIYYRYSVDGAGFEDWIEYDEKYPITFDESRHDIEYYCVDALGNKGPVHTETDIVDTTKPEINVTVGDPKVQKGNDLYIRDNTTLPGTPVTVDVTDAGVHKTGINYCEYSYTVNGQPVGGTQRRTQFPFIITFLEDSTHVLTINCYDNVENMDSDIETYLVDSIPPETDKEYGLPFVSRMAQNERTYHWINSSTPITLSASDAKVGVKFIKYRVTQMYVDDKYCDVSCNFEEVSGAFNYVSDDEKTFTIDEPSCHFIEFASEDLLGNTELMQSQCVFVDNEAPDTNKTIGEPKVIRTDGQTTTVYVNKSTPITLDCEDPTPHPVNNVTLFWSIGTNVTGSWVQGTWHNSKQIPVAINFENDSYHNLQYYCIDELGNAEAMQTELDVVDSQPPTITTTVVGPQYYNNTEGNLYIDGVTVIDVTATDPQPHPVDGVMCTWSYTVNGQGLYHVVEGVAVQGVSDKVASPFTVHFPEESRHVLTINCEDALHNANTTSYTYLVDKTAPTITKRFNGPQYPINDDQDGYAHWINNETNVVLTVEDTGPHMSGIKETKYRVTLLNSDDACNNYELCQNANDGDGVWTDYTKPFTITDESCHLIEYYSMDNVEKKQEKKQCVFVDLTVPEPVKTVGKPGSALNNGTQEYTFTYYPEVNGRCWNGKNDSIDCWKVTTMTPISLDCKDQAPHPVDHSIVEFKVDFDGEDITSHYCNASEHGIYGEFDEETGYCSVTEDEAPVNFYFGEESEHNLKYRCTDALGNTGPVDDEKFKVEGTAFNITLNKKWNLISVPFVMLDGSIDDAFKDVASTVESVWTYDGETGDWYVYTPGPAPDTLTEMKPGWGYWVKSYEPSVLTIGGSLFSPAMTPPDKNVVAGWNLIGYYGTEGLLKYNGPVGNGDPATCALRSLVDTTMGFPKYPAIVTYWEPDNPNLWKYLDEYDDMDPGAGYWLEMDKADIYTYSTTCGWELPM